VFMLLINFKKLAPLTAPWRWVRTYCLLRHDLLCNPANVLENMVVSFFICDVHITGE